jgi:hypothetical protein
VIGALRGPARTRLFAAGALAAAAVLVATPVAAWGHSSGESRTVAAQVEAGHLVVVVGYQPASGGAALAMVAYAAKQPKGTGSLALRAILAARAVGPLAVQLDGARVEASSVESKLFFDPPGSTRLAIAVMLIYDLPPRATALEVGIDDEITRFSWVNHDACARTVESVWPPRSWVTGVAAFLLKVGGPDSGASPCASSPSPSPSGSPSSPPVPPGATGSSKTTTRPTAKRRSSSSRAPSAARSSATSSRSSSPAR